MITDWKLDFMAKALLEHLWTERKESVLIALDLIKYYYKEEKSNETQSDTVTIQAKLDKANSRLTNLIAMRADGEISKDEYQAMRSPVDEEIKKLQKALDEIPQEKSNPKGLDIEGIRSTLNSFIDFSGSTISHDVVNQFVYLITPTSDTTFDWYVNLNGTADVKATFTAEGRKKNCIIKLEEIEKISSVHREKNEDNAHFIKNPHIFTYLHKLLHIPGKISTLVGVGSSICGGSAVAATASVIDADDEEVAQAISVIFFFNMLAAIFFPALGALLGFSTTNGEAFGIFAGTAINDTSSVTAAASTWDSLYGLGSQTLDKAVTVKLTRTLAIIPITLVLAFVRTKRAKTDGTKVNFKKIFPMFILYFLLASVITTICVSAGVSASVFAPLKTLSKFLIVMAMCAVGLNTNIVKLVRTGGKPLIMGFCCWVGIAGMSLLMQHVLGIW